MSAKRDVARALTKKRGPYSEKDLNTALTPDFLERRFDPKYQELREYPCRAGPLKSLYRCRACQGLDGPISYTPIVEGICADKKCYDYESLSHWLENARVPTIPHSGRQVSVHALENLIFAKSPPKNAKKACHFSGRISK